MKRLAILTIIGVMACTVNTKAQFLSFKRKKKVEVAKKDTTTKAALAGKYSKILSGAETQVGFVSLHLKKEKKKDKVYLEVPSDVLGRNLIFASKVSAVSNEKVAFAGQLQRMKYYYIQKDGDRLIFNSSIDVKQIDSTTTIASSFKKHNLPVVEKIFAIEAKSAKDSSFVIDITNWMFETKDNMAVPLNQPFSNKVNQKYTLHKDGSSIESIQAFEKNANIECKFDFTGKMGNFAMKTVRTFVLLPELAMQPRLLQPEMNYFATKKYEYKLDDYSVANSSYIMRWNIQPKEEDIEKYKRGELVEPKNPIVWYVDDAFPESIKQYVKDGIEDWQKAFEEIGFKNAIVAVDYPKDDPDFNPDDISYNCVRYVTIQIPNAMGPMWADLNSGEIIHANVYFCHSILNMVRNMRLVQTGAVDPAARKKVLDDEIMGPIVRNIVAHEIGHTLGLKHNMAGSNAIPVDSLRSATFTNKYGTTASIMDYTRFNYVAQPGDEGVNLLPPHLGVFDKYAIRLGYKPNFGLSVKDDEKVIKEIIKKHAHKPMYRFGAQAQPGITPSDHTALTEDLGNDAVKATKYGIKNLKYIMEHLVDWTVPQDETYAFTHSAYRLVRIQLYSYIQHVVPLIGGKYNTGVQGVSDEPRFIPVSKEKQKEATNYVIDLARELPDWFSNKEIQKVSTASDDPSKWYQRYVVDKLMAQGTIERLYWANRFNDQGYTIEEYLNDVYNNIWNPTIKGKQVTESDRVMQYMHIYHLTNRLDLKAALSSGGNSKAFADLDEMDVAMLYEFEHQKQFQNLEEISIGFTGKFDDKYNKIESKTLLFAQLKQILRLLKRAKENAPDSKSRMHYDYLYNVLADII